MREGVLFFIGAVALVVMIIGGAVIGSIYVFEQQVEILVEHGVSAETAKDLIEAWRKYDE